MKTIELVELEGVELDRLPDEVLKVLLSTGGFRVSDGRLIPRTVAGFVQVGEWRLIVRPRLRRGDFMRMLFAMGIPEGMDESGFNSGDLFEELALFYLLHLREVLATHGPPRTYSPRMQESPYVKGKIERVYPHRVRQRVWEMKADPWASLLLIAARRCARAVSDRGFYLLREVEALMGNVEEQQDVPDLPLPDEPYRTLVLLAKAIVEGESVHLEHGERPSFSFFVDTARLFESYVLKFLSENFRTDYQRQFRFDSITIRPDFMVGEFPADAKYRFSIEQSDIYQAISYAVLLESDRVFLLYPYLDFQINISCCKIMGVGVLVHDVIEKLKKEVHDA